MVIWIYQNTWVRETTSYDIRQLEQHLSVHCTHGDNKSIIYARVCYLKQRDDLRHQVEELKEAYPRFRVISEIVSGINLKRPVLRSCFDAMHSGSVKEVVFLHRDRFARFAFGLLECFFKSQGVKLVVHCKNQEWTESTQQLAEDRMTFTIVFVATHHGKRAAVGRRRCKRKREEDAKDGAQQGKKKCTTYHVHARSVFILEKRKYRC